MTRGVKEEDRQLIDEAVTTGRVTHVPTGVSAFDRQYRWNGSKLVDIGPQTGARATKRRRKFDILRLRYFALVRLTRRKLTSFRSP